jgi:hypothetical protein
VSPLTGWLIFLGLTLITAALAASILKPPFDGEELPWTEEEKNP